MMKSEELIEISENKQEGYNPMVDYESWRVAVLTDCEELEAPLINWMQKHNETDEVFVLLKGSCILFTGGKEDNQIGEIEAVNMEPCKLYNVKKGVWHNHTLSKDSLVLIVENRDTNDDNSPECILNESQRAKLVSLTHTLWGKADEEINGVTAEKTTRVTV